MTPAEITDLVHLPAMARAALMSPAHFARKFRAAQGRDPSGNLVRNAQA